MNQRFAACILNAISLLSSWTLAGSQTGPPDKAVLEALPLASYDTDTGFGYGIKAFSLNRLKADESLDLILFASTKGERWLKAVFSVPDFERRQGTVYPLALDITLEANRWPKYNFFGLGPGSRFEDRELYQREFLDLQVTCSRGFSSVLVGQAGLKYRKVKNSNFEKDGFLEAKDPSLAPNRVSYGSVMAGLRYDSRDSFINPSTGWVAGAEVELAKMVPGTSPRPRSTSFTRNAWWIHHYHPLFRSKTILALRARIQGLKALTGPIQVLLPLGGGTTLRGLPLDRFLGRASAVTNVELRFPLVWRLGGLVALDSGKVWDSWSQASLHRWVTDPAVGLRLYMKTFVVRADLGFGSQTTGFYFNFGHIF